MTWALLAALTVVSCYAVIQYIAIRRLSRPIPPPQLSDASELGEAILDVVEASIVESAGDWSAQGSDLIHVASGFRVRIKHGRGPRLFKNAAELALSEGRQASLLRAVQLNNARHALDALGGDDE